MILEMYIDNLLIDRTEVDFASFDTVARRENEVEELKSFLSTAHVIKLVEAEAEPHFFLLASSRANKIISDDRFENRLLDELKKDLKQKPVLKICR